MIQQKIRNSVNNYLYEKRWNKTWKRWNRAHLTEVYAACKMANIQLKEQPGEQEWLRKWSRLTPNVSVDYYRFYSEFIGNDPNILSDDIFHAVIDPIINDKVSLPVFLNKNLYEILISKEVFPICVFRNMNGDYLDSNYKDFKMDEAQLDSRLLKNDRIVSQGRFIIKPTQETGRGKGVHLFCLKNGKWVNDNNDFFSLSYLDKEYGKDFIIQECIEPSDFVRQFNTTSYSTCRIYTYRSVIDGSMHFLGGYLRVGDLGSFKDNIGSGGYAIPILCNGSLASFASNGTRKRFETVNGIDLKKGCFKVPNFEKILELAYFGAERNPLNRVLSFDVLLDTENQPHIIEFNLKAQTITTMQTTYKSFFGEYTDEIIEYCLDKLKKGNYPVYSSYLKKR